MRVPIRAFFFLNFSDNIANPQFECKTKSKPANAMTCHEHGEPSKIDEEECEEYDKETMMPKHIIEDLKELQNDRKTKLDEIEIVNLEDDELVRETQVSVYLMEEEKEDLIKLFKQYINVFAWAYDDMPILIFPSFFGTGQY
ncbi:uncharacterized protein LOC129887383 [Solanum dulcamara]|uniref:uncharacterized protein LOC129887383 n=1 Tax=Solanum dulcamara TaxID=45834 RepID=UPI002486447A|nr:uncharacterized protein LOC129887383 [Solanum dulcamara]